MSNQHAPLEVLVQGGDVETSALVYGVVQNALTEAGFTDITVESPQGDTEANVSQIPSLLDLVRTERPALFDTPIAVKQIATPEEVVAFAVDHPDTLGIASVVYGTDPAVVEEIIEANAPLPDDVTDVEFEDVAA
ncbi:hypothetical protein [Paraburkholderia sp. BCC1886]|uniref:hypothetical protein n=1 Tax=Paraburkholderia sp. BCC1886 TaxID=2562670 RepID=UPI0011830D70|nr:hypothetical protein [Paraburkholderia sp. BCC1886]